MNLIEQRLWKLTGRVSIFRGQVKRNAANKVEGYYQLLAGQPGIKQIQELQEGSTYIYPTKVVNPFAMFELY